MTTETDSSGFHPVTFICYGCGDPVTVQQHVAATSIQAAACEKCRKKWDSSERAKPDVASVITEALALTTAFDDYGEQMAKVEQAAIAACEGWAAQGRWADWVKLAALVTERDKARMLAEMNANLSAGHCRRMHTVEEERDAAQQLLTWLATRIVDLADSHLCDIDSQTNCVCQDLQRVAEPYVGADGKVWNIIDALNEAQQDADALAEALRSEKDYWGDVVGSGSRESDHFQVIRARANAALAAHDARKAAPR